MKCIITMLIICLATSSAAADASEDKAGAETLFEDGRKLLQAGKVMEACPKFEASLRLDRAVGTELNLADCYERLGRFASAWGMFRQAADEARRLDKKEAEQIANERARALEPKLSRLTIQSPQPAIAGVVVTRNGIIVDAALLGTPMPVDPGPHRIQCRAPGRKDWTQDLEIKIGETMVTSVPSLAVDATVVTPDPSRVSPSNEAKLQIVVGQRGEEYEIELATTGGLQRCQGKVTRDKPCMLKAPNGPGSLTLRGTASLSEELDFSGKPLLITVGKRSRWARTTGLITGGIGVVVFGAGLYACSSGGVYRDGTDPNTNGPINGACVLPVAFGGLGMIAGGALVIYDAVAAKHEITVRSPLERELPADGGAMWGVRTKKHRTQTFASPTVGGAMFGLAGRF